MHLRNTMPPKRLLKNQYLGINAHLHSTLQNAGGWESFHGIHIAHLTTLLQAQLLPMGYEADIEQSLQIKRTGERASYPISDVTIYDTDPLRAMQPVTRTMSATHEVVVPIPAILNFSEEEIQYYKAIGVYKAAYSRPERGEPVAWVELLSPSNKPTGRDFEQYREKRAKVVESGIVFVEIDYLHQFPPTFDQVANYAPRKGRPASDAYPYRITVIDPHPDVLEGIGRSWQFKVDEPLPTMTIPLSADDKLSFDFGKPYRKTFEEMFYGNKVDYSQLPLNFESYNDDDQARIVSRMLAVLRAENPENEPIPVETIPLHSALEQLKALAI
jgi:hypothetical protein